jgi:hypothetical protein
MDETSKDARLPGCRSVIRNARVQLTDTNLWSSHEKFKISSISVAAVFVPNRAPALAIALIGTMARAEPLAYVTTAFEDTVSVIDTATNTVKPWLDTAQRNIRLRWGSFVKTLSRGVAPIDWKHRF